MTDTLPARCPTCRRPLSTLDHGAAPRPRCATGRHRFDHRNLCRTCGART